MTYPVINLMIFGGLVVGAGAWLVWAGATRARPLGGASTQDIRLLGLIHVLVGAWFMYGALTDNQELKYGACKMMSKARTCSWSSSV